MAITESPAKQEEFEYLRKQDEKSNMINIHARELEEDDIFSIREDKRNYRRHSDKNLSLIGKSLDEFGAGRSIVADNSGQVIGGNGTLREANKRGIPKRIIHTTGDELVVVVRDDIAPDDPRRAKLAIMDNSTTDTSDFDLMMLQEDFSIPELDDMGIEIPEEKEEKEPDEVAIEETYEVVIECANEEEQQEIFEKLTNEGMTCRLLTL